MSDILICLIVPAIHKVQGAADRAQQTQENFVLAFALAQYQRDQGRFPKELAALVPRYMQRIPPDLFSGKALMYRRGTVPTVEFESLLDP